MENVILKFNALEIVIDKNDLLYHEMRRKFQESAFQKSKKFSAEIKKHATIESFLNSVRDDANRLILEAIEEAINELIGLRILTIDSQNFLNNYYSQYEYFDSVVSDIEEKFYEIVENSQLADQYRTSRRQSRGKMIGGGFGVGGALKGAAQAGAFNLTTNVAHATFNGVVKIGSNIADGIKKNGLLSQENLNLVTNALYHSIFYIHVDLIEAINKVQQTNYRSCYTSAEIDSVNSILNNLDKAQMSDAEMVNYYVEMMKIYPYNRKIYEKMVNDYGDRTGHIKDIAGYFGINLTEFKLLKLKEKHFSKINKVRTESEANELLQGIVKDAFDLGIHEESFSKELSELKDKIEVFVKKERLVDNILFDTADLADVARKELEFIKTLLIKYPKPCYDHKYKLIKELKASNCGSKVYVKYVEKIMSEMETYIDEAVIVENITCDSIDEANLLRDLQILSNKVRIGRITKDEALIELTLIESKLNGRHSNFLSLKRSEVEQSKASKRAVNASNQNEKNEKKFTVVENALRFLARYIFIPLFIAAGFGVMIGPFALIVWLLVMVYLVSDARRNTEDIEKKLTKSNRIVLYHHTKDHFVIVKKGINFGALLFGCLIPFNNRDLRNGVIAFFLSPLTLYIYNIWLMFNYNKMLVKASVKKGYEPFDAEQKEKLVNYVGGEVLQQNGIY